MNEKYILSPFLIIITFHDKPIICLIHHRLRVSRMQKNCDWQSFSNQLAMPEELLAVVSGSWSLGESRCTPGHRWNTVQSWRGKVVHRFRDSSDLLPNFGWWLILLTLSQLKSDSWWWVHVLVIPRSWQSLRSFTARGIDNLAMADGWKISMVHNSGQWSIISHWLVWLVLISH